MPSKTFFAAESPSEAEPSSSDLDEYLKPVFTKSMEPSLTSITGFSGFTISLSSSRSSTILSPEAFAPAVVTALELSGLEDSFVLDDEHMLTLYGELHAACPDGRVILFPGRNGRLSPGQKQLLHRSAADGIPVYRDRAAPRLLSLYTEDGQDDDGPSPDDMKARLLWLHGDAVLLDASASGADAVFLPGHAASPCPAPLTAGPGMEGCWPGPSPDFFRTRTLSAFLVQENQS